MWAPSVSRLLRAAFGSRSGSFRGGTLSPPPPEGAKKVTLELLDHLEVLALVDFRNWEGVERLEKAIEFADQLHTVPTDGIEPMESVLENRHLYLREDKVTEGNSAEELLKAAKLTDEGYFVAPPGNIPLPKLEERENFLKEEH
ncbi:hypothetical protein JRQ81_007551 [Phrynocephalus forsythii]|uniref:Glutamyl-tRNA(Gln) amidotransferase subunit C, mitochondrial n=1 Tax=Phrynocephalus forsythii TaxID=171643 RepID=A0A9Q0XCQ7_9SAUR|nr:hypothetical protein JRQ81_007551 [Phrynocephalus forsythii]